MLIHLSNVAKLSLVLLFGLISPSAYSLTYPLTQQDLIGELQTTRVLPGESLGDIGRRFDIGVYEMIEANPLLDPWLPETNAEVLLPMRFILPPGPRHGLVLNLAEMRLYFYHPDKKKVSTYPIGIGRREWPTPVGQTKITAKTHNPTWHPPASIRAEHALSGDILPAKVPPGPDNPLGEYAFRMGFASVLLHGTNQPGGVGLRSSHGCIRMLPADVAELYPWVPVGTVVRIIHAPYKLGWEGDTLYMEAHEPLKETRFEAMDSTLYLIEALEKLPGHSIDWLQANAIAEEASGVPLPLERPLNNSQ